MATKNYLSKLFTITSTLFDNLVGAYEVCDKEEEDLYFKHFIILIFKDRKPHTIYGTHEKDMSHLLDEVAYLHHCLHEDKGGKQ